ELHLPIAEQAAIAGKHVYVEKPIANTLADGLMLSDLGKRYAVQVMVGHCARLLSGVRLTKEAIDRGELGRVCYIECNFSNDRGLDLTPDNWRWYRARSPGGCLSQIAIHCFDILHYLGGEILEAGSMASKLSPTGAEVDDQSLTTVRFVDGKLGFVGSSWTSPGIFSIKVVGTKALMHYQIDQSAWGSADRLHESAELYFQKRSEGFAQRNLLPVPPGDMFCEELDMFADAIASDTPSSLSGENGCVALAVIYAALQSIEEHGRYIDVRGLLASHS
ncbi:MAG: Gfo/Idh/MocA family oxidoreductase, partial [Candidimonas sp.]